MSSTCRSSACVMMAFHPGGESSAPTSGEFPQAFDRQHASGMTAIGKLMVKQPVQKMPLRRENAEGPAAMVAPLRAGEHLLGGREHNGRERTAPRCGFRPCPRVQGAIAPADDDLAAVGLGLRDSRVSTEPGWRAPPRRRAPECPGRASRALRAMRPGQREMHRAFEQNWNDAVRVQRRDCGMQLLVRSAWRARCSSYAAASRLVTWVDRAAVAELRRQRWQKRNAACRAKISGGKTSWATARSTSACQEKPGWNKRKRSSAVDLRASASFAITLPSSASRSSSVTVGGRRSKGDPNQLGVI